jgi:hypothetical protein
MLAIDQGGDVNKGLAELETQAQTRQPAKLTNRPWKSKLMSDMALFSFLRVHPG